MEKRRQISARKFRSQLRQLVTRNVTMSQAGSSVSHSAFGSVVVNNARNDVSRGGLQFRAILSVDLPAVVTATAVLTQDSVLRVVHKL